MTEWVEEEKIVIGDLSSAACSLLEEEFNLLFKVLTHQDHKKYWQYCYYVGLTLEAYYRAYDKPGKQKDYQEKNAVLLKYIEGQNPQKKASVSVGWIQKIDNDLNELKTVPRHVSKVKTWIGLINIMRLELVFSRIAVQQFLLVSDELHWLDKLNQLLGRAVDPKAMAAILDGASPVFNALSVGLYGTRLLINTSLVLKHTFATNSNEQQWQRFCDEIYNRRYQLLNDSAWGVVNGLTNYARYFKITAATANMLMGIFLCFDLALLLWHRELMKKDYECRYNHFKNELNTTALEDSYRSILERQIQCLEREWDKSDGTNWCDIAGSVLLFGGYGASMVINTVAAIPVCFLVCVFAVSLFASDEEGGAFYMRYKAWQNSHEPEKAEAYANMQEARDKFALAVAKNSFVPMAILTLFATSLPLGLTVTALYLGYEYSRGVNATQYDTSYPPKLTLAA